MIISCRKPLVLLLLLLSASALEAQPVVQIRGYNQLYLLDLASGSESLLYTSPYPEIRTVKISADGSLFALLEVDHSKKHRVNYLKVLDRKGTLKYEAQPDVRKYNWDPGSNRLAYITGTFYEGGVSFIPTGFYLYDFLVDKETRITTDGFEPFELNWVRTATEDAIYVESLSRDLEKQFLRYNLLRETFEIIPFRSIGVSPDGKYYGNYEVNCRCVKIFDRSTQTEQSRYNLSDTDRPVGWAYNDSHLYVVEKFAYNKEKHQVVIGDELKTVTLNGSVSEAAIIVLDGDNGQVVQTVSGVLPNRTPYQFMFTKPDVLITISPDAAANARQAPARTRGQITITIIPEKYRQ
jgi:dipeptidyl aminopeptidase/acylaminoacyl peptidase